MGSFKLIHPLGHLIIYLEPFENAVSLNDNFHHVYYFHLSQSLESLSRGVFCFFTFWNNIAIVGINARNSRYLYYFHIDQKQTIFV